MSSSDNTWVEHLREAVLQTTEQCFGKTWGYDVQNNWGCAIDISSIVDALQDVPFHIHHRFVTTKGIEIYVTVDDTITTVAEITRLVHSLMSRVAEDALVILPIHTTQELRYWFLTGSETHGHIGEIIIQQQHHPQIDWSVLSVT